MHGRRTASSKFRGRFITRFRFNSREMSELALSGLAGNLLTSNSLGNAELLEAITPHSQVLPSRRRTNRTTTKGLYRWILGGKAALSLHLHSHSRANMNLGSQLDTRFLLMALYICISQTNRNELQFSVPIRHAMQSNVFFILPSGHTSISLPNSVRASMNFLATISHKSIRSLSPFSNASTAEPSGR